MLYTLGQAKKRLAASSSAYGQDDLRDLVNNAIQALAGMTGWECLRKVLRFSSAGPGFVLPQGCAGLVRACVNGRPTTVRGQDFRFIQSGPGEMRRPPKGFAMVKPDNILDIGMKPVMREPYNKFRLYATTPTGDRGTAASGVYPKDLVVRGLTPSGDNIRFDLALWPETSTSITPDSHDLQMITEIVVKDVATEYYTLYAVDQITGDKFQIGYYNPEVKVPQFRHYELSGIAPGQPVELLVEARVDPLPLIEDTDVLPFEAVEPIEWMIRANWQMKAGEVTAAKNYQDMAAKWLKAQEIVDDTIQTSIVINSVFDGSPGEISMDSVNI